MSLTRTRRPWPRSAIGSTACRWRSSWPRPGPVLPPQATARPAGAAVAAAHRRGARPADPAADAAGRDRLELRPARRGRAGRSSAASPSSSAAVPSRRPRPSATPNDALDIRCPGRPGVARRQELARQAGEAADGAVRFGMLETIREFGLEQPGARRATKHSSAPTTPMLTSFWTLAEEAAEHSAAWPRAGGLAPPTRVRSTIICGPRWPGA